jgi:hypothetical protein
MNNRIPRLFTISSIFFLTRIEYQWRRSHADWEGRPRDERQAFFFQVSRKSASLSVSSGVRGNPGFSHEEEPSDV